MLVVIRVQRVCDGLVYTVYLYSPLISKRSLRFLGITFHSYFAYVPCLCKYPVLALTSDGCRVTIKLACIKVRAS